MKKGVVSAALYGAVIIGAPITAAHAQWAPGSELVGQSVQIETNGVVNTVYFDAGGGLRIMTPGGSTVPGTWSAANGQLCMQAGAAQECVPYSAAFQSGQQVTLVSSCQSTQRWLPNLAQQSSAGERG